MSVDKFNSFGGYSTGIPPVEVIDASGNVITNVLTTGNVAANVVYASYYKYSNGQPFTAVPGGSTTQLQFNNAGAFGGIPNVTWNGSLLSLGDIANISIAGGVGGYFLQTDGAGNLSWAVAGGGGGNGSPGGANTEIQFNDAGVFAGVVGFAFDRDNNTFSVPTANIITINTTAINTTNVSATGNISAAYFSGDGSNLTNVTANLANYVIQSNQANITAVGTLISLAVSGNVAAGNVAGGNLISANFVTGTLTTTAQPNITSTGVLTSLAVTGNIISGNVYANSGTIGAGLLTGVITTTAQPNITTVGILDNLTVAGNISVSETVSAGNLNTDGTLTADNIAVSNNANITGNLRATGNINFATSSNVNFGTLANIHISGGSYGYVLTTDGVGNLTWELGESGNGPGGFNTQVQFNANGAFAGSSNLTFDTSTQTFAVGGNLIANTMQIGSGIYEFSKSQVHFATTAGTTPDQVLYSIPAADLMGTEYHIIATNTADGIRQSLKISSVIYDTELLFNEYAGLQVNGAVGSFHVEYDPGDIMNPPSVKLKVTPTAATQTVYRMLITVYSE